MILRIPSRFPGMPQEWQVPDPEKLGVRSVHEVGVYLADLDGPRADGIGHLHVVVKLAIRERADLDTDRCPGGVLLDLLRQGLEVHAGRMILGQVVSDPDGRVFGLCERGRGRQCGKGEKGTNDEQGTDDAATGK